MKYLKKEEGNRLGIDKYPNIDCSGSVRGMKKMYWGEKALVVKCGSYYYKVPQNIYNMAY